MESSLGNARPSTTPTPPAPADLVETVGLALLPRKVEVKGGDVMATRDRDHIRLGSREAESDGAGYAEKYVANVRGFVCELISRIYLSADYAIEAASVGLDEASQQIEGMLSLDLELPFRQKNPTVMLAATPVLWE